MTRSFATFFAFALLANGVCAGGDWPQIHGPNRDGRAASESLAEKWPKTGPQLAWKADVGEGYSGPVVADGRCYVFHRVKDKETLTAFDAATGERVWDWSTAAGYRGGVDADRGPRATPVVVDPAIEKTVVVYGAKGRIAKIDAGTGAEIWARDLGDDYDAPDGYFGAGSSPLVLGDRVIVNVGGKKASIVAVALATGQTLWETGQDDAGYSSPIAMQVGGRDSVVVISHTKVWSVDPATGDAVVVTPYGRPGPRVNAAAPLNCDGQLFVTSSYNVGAIAFDVSGAQPKKVWGDDRTLSSQYTTPVFANGYLYGTHGREDAGEAEFRCVDAKTGKTAWSRDGFHVAHTLVAGDKLVVLDSKGRLRLVDLDPMRYSELAAAELFPDGASTRSPPALSNGKLFVKANGRGRGVIAVFDLGAGEK